MSETVFELAPAVFELAFKRPSSVKKQNQKEETERTIVRQLFKRDDVFGSEEERYNLNSSGSRKVRVT